MAEEDKREELLKFLHRTKDGEYAEISPYSLDYIRVSEKAECEVEDDENFTYVYC